MENRCNKNKTPLAYSTKRKTKQLLVNPLKIDGTDTELKTVV